MRSDLTTSQRVTLQTESAQSNQVVRVLPAMQAYSFFFGWVGGVGAGGGGSRAKAASLCLHYQSNIINHV